MGGIDKPDALANCSEIFHFQNIIQSGPSDIDFIIVIAADVPFRHAEQCDQLRINKFGDQWNLICS